MGARCFPPRRNRWTVGVYGRNHLARQHCEQRTNALTPTPYYHAVTPPPLLQVARRGNSALHRATARGARRCGARAHIPTRAHYLPTHTRAPRTRGARMLMGIGCHVFLFCLPSALVIPLHIPWTLSRYSSPRCSTHARVWARASDAGLLTAIVRDRAD